MKSRKNAISHPILRVRHKTTIVRHYSLQLQVSIAYWLLHSTHYTQSHTEQKQTINTFFLHRLSHNTVEEKIKIPKSTTPFFILILLLSAVQVPIINHRSTTNNPLSHQPPWDPDFRQQQRRLSSDPISTSHCKLFYLSFFTFCK